MPWTLAIGTSFMVAAATSSARIKMRVVPVPVPVPMPVSMPMPISVPVPMSPSAGKLVHSLLGPRCDVLEIVTPRTE